MQLNPQKDTIWVGYHFEDAQYYNQFIELECSPFKSDKDEANFWKYEHNTVVSQYYDVCYIEILLITVPNLCSSHYKTI